MWPGHWPFGPITGDRKLLAYSKNFLLLISTIPDLFYPPPSTVDCIMPSHFENLPIELACEIIRHAMATPREASNTQMRTEANKTACSLALVSASMRSITMPFVLRTVILSSHNAVVSFLSALELQKSFVVTGSRLRLNYTKVIRRFWSSVYIQPISQSQQTQYNNYRLLYDIICDIEELGFDWNSIYLLIEVLELKTGPWTRLLNPLHTWKTTNITLSGHPRWDTVLASGAGHEFLENLTHLTLWGPVTRAYRPLLGTHSGMDHQDIKFQTGSATHLSALFLASHTSHTRSSTQRLTKECRSSPISIIFLV